jgi:4'-phosphopantetheinyl transferase
MLRVYLASSENRFPDELEREYLARIPTSMHAAIQRYRRWEDRQATMIGKLLLQRALGGLAVQNTSLSLENIEVTETGKPYIRGEVGFNISHSGGVVALVLVDDGTAGIDVEKIRPIQLEDFSRYLPEVSAAETGDPSARLNMFYRCWTRKEAVLKAEGSGLLAPLEQVRLQGDKAFFQEQVWHLRAIDCGASHCCHVATSEYQPDCHIEMVHF